MDSLVEQQRQKFTQHNSNQQELYFTSGIHPKTFPVHISQFEEIKESVSKLKRKNGGTFKDQR